MSRGEDTRYSFETQPTRQTLRKAADMVERLLLRLGADPKALEHSSDEAQRALSSFATACHLNIEWYDRHRKRQRRLYLIFGIFTGLLVLAMPVAIFLTAKASHALAGQIGVIITGVLSAHRALASALEKRNMERHFWKAQADLKSILYAFEDKWRACAVADEPGSDNSGAGDSSSVGNRAGLNFVPGFLQALKQRTSEALDIKQQEQEQFFAERASPFSGISEILGVVGTSGSAILQTAQERKRKRIEAVTKVTEMEATQRARNQQCSKLASELAALEGSTDKADVDRRKALELAIDKLQRDILQYDLDLAIARSKLDVS